MEYFLKAILVLNALLVALACMFAFGQSTLRASMKYNFLRYLALRVSKALIEHEYISWEDLLNLYKRECKLLLHSECPPTYKQLRDTLSAAREILITNLPLSSDKWKMIIRNMHRAIPRGTNGEVIIFEKPDFRKVAKREAIYSIPFLSIFADRLLTADSFWKVLDILMPGLTIIVLIQTIHKSGFPLWLTLLLASASTVFTLRSCSLSVAEYALMVRSAFSIPKAVRDLENNILVSNKLSQPIIGNNGQLEFKLTDKQ